VTNGQLIVLIIAMVICTMEITSTIKKVKK